MFYYIFFKLLYTRLEGSESYLVKALNVFQYVTFRTTYATITALLISLLFGGRVIRWLQRMKVGQQIREEGPADHHVKKGTPTMGGILVIGSVMISTLLWARLNGLYIWIALIATLGFAAIGFIDDYSKMVKQRSLGLSGMQKLAGQFLIAIGVFAALYFSGAYTWNVSLPFFKATAQSQITNVFPVIYAGLIILVLVGFSNAVNLTDGLDGLAIGTTLIAMSAMTAFTYLIGDARWSQYLDLTHRPEAAELTVFCGAMVGASLGFLWYNAPPAEVFMGDVGSLAIGGAIGTVAILTKQEFMLVMVGGVFVIEAGSVMLQVASFKMTKRRIFKMAPLHHHFELSGWKESKVVFRFLILAILFALLSLSTLKLR
ncbi:MAG: phospho-N-acetylmuramoyl-pentapeptide-transferase [Pyrinomonadaceae bacterium]